jgi:hypothetical protein
MFKAKIIRFAGTGNYVTDEWITGYLSKEKNSEMYIITTEMKWIDGAEFSVEFEFIDIDSVIYLGVNA